MNDYTLLAQLLEFANNPLILTTLDDLESALTTDELPLFTQSTEKDYAH